MCLLILFLAVPGMEARASCKARKSSTAQLHPTALDLFLVGKTQRCLKAQCSELGVKANKYILSVSHARSAFSHLGNLSRTLTLSRCSCFTWHNFLLSFTFFPPVLVFRLQGNFSILGSGYYSFLPLEQNLELKHKQRCAAYSR